MPKKRQKARPRIRPRPASASSRLRNGPTTDGITRPQRALQAVESVDLDTNDTQVRIPVVGVGAFDHQPFAGHLDR